MAFKPQKNVYTDIDMNFDLNPITNDLSTVTDVAAVKQSLRNLMLNRKLWNFDNMDVYQMLFEDPDFLFKNVVIIGQMEERLLKYEPRASFIRIEVSKQFNGQVILFDIFFGVKTYPQTEFKTQVFKKVS